MEDIAPPLKCLIEMQTSLHNGESVRLALSRYSQRHHDEFASTVRRFLITWERGAEWREVFKSVRSSYRRAVLEVAAAGMSGQSIQMRLEELRVEVNRACEMEIKEHLDLLPLKMLIPLLFFQFPAFLVLLFGPLVAQFLEGLSK